MIKFKQRTVAESVKSLEIAMPKIIISKEAMTKMMLFIEGCTEEIGWLGTATKYKNNYYIEDVTLFEQEVHGTTTEITPDGLAKFGEEILQLEDGVDIWNNLKVWGHSHVRMAVSPSAQDNKQMETFAEGGHDWFIRIIGNKDGDLKIDIYNYELGIIYNDLRYKVVSTKEEMDIEEEILKLKERLETLQIAYLNERKTAVDQEIKEKVKKKTYVTTTTWAGRPGVGYSSYTTAHADAYTEAYLQGYTNGAVVEHVYDTEKKTGIQTRLNVGSEEKARKIPNGMINTEDDVFEYLDLRVIEEAATCRTIYDLNETLRDNQYVPMDYNTYEKNLILEVAQKYFKDYCTR